MRIERRLPVAGNIQLEPPALGRHRLAAVAVAAVAGFVSGKVMVHLRVQRPLGNPDASPLVLIEVQTGGYLGEDDIVRFDDVYGR